VSLRRKTAFPALARPFSENYVEYTKLKVNESELQEGDLLVRNVETDTPYTIVGDEVVVVPHTAITLDWLLESPHDLHGFLEQPVVYRADAEPDEAECEY